MSHPCHSKPPCNRAVKGGPYTRDQCALCWNAINSPAYQILWGIDPATLQPMTPEQLAARQFAPARGCCPDAAPGVVFAE